MDMKDLIIAFKKHLKIIFMIIFVCTVCGVFMSYSIPSKYEAKTDLLVNSTASNNENTSVAMSEIDANLRLIETYKQILKSDRMVSRVNTELNNRYSRTELASKIKIEADNGSQIITIIATENSVKGAADLANTYAKVFKEEILTLMNFSNITILKEVAAEVDIRKIEPIMPVFIIITFLLGVLISGVLVIISEVYFPLLDSKRKVECILKVPYLGSIIFAKEPKSFSKKSKRPVPSFQSEAKFPRATNEDFGMLAANIHYLVREKQVKTIMLASPHIGDGKTFIGCNLAVKLAMNGQRVLFIDANLWKSDGRQLFNLPERKGLTSIIAGFYEVEEIVQQTSVENLSFIGTGPLPPNPARFLQSENMEKIINELKEAFDVIIIDTSALVKSDATCLLPFIDGCIYITDALKTKEVKAVQSLESLKELGGKVLGVVLNSKKSEEITTA